MVEGISAKRQTAPPALLIFPLFLSLLTVTQLINVTHLEGIADDFSGMVLQAVAGNSTYDVPYDAVEKQDGAWVLVNATLPDEPYILNVLSVSNNPPEADAPASSSEPALPSEPYFVDFAYIEGEGINSDFSNLVIFYASRDAQPEQMAFTMVGFEPGSWASIALERAPQDGESIIFSAMDAGPALPESNPQNETVAPDVPDVPGIPDGVESDSSVENPMENPGANLTANQTANATAILDDGGLYVSDGETGNGTSFIGNYPIEAVNETNETIALYANLDSPANISNETIATDGFSGPPTQPAFPSSWGALSAIKFRVHGSHEDSFMAGITIASGLENVSFGLGADDSVFSCPAGKYDISIRPPGGPAPKGARPFAPIEELRLRGVELSGASGFDIGLEYLSPNDVPFGKSARQAYAIDPTAIPFASGEVSVRAKGSELYKCAEWDFQSQTCLGSWAKLMDITPGEIYTIQLSPDDPAYAEYNTTYGAPRCGNSSSPCYANSSLLRSRDTLATPEPNQPNTLDSCADGTLGTYLVDESVENITITDLNGTTFNPGDTVNVTAVVNCYTAGSPASDNINFLYTSSASSPSWTTIGYTDPCPLSGINTITKTFRLDPVEGEHAVRVIIQYNGNPTATCGTGTYDDTDDVAFMVNGTSIPQAGDAIIAYRSNTGVFGVNSPKIRFFNSSGSGAWGPEIELPTAGSPVRWAVVKSSPVSTKLAIVTLSDDGNLDGYVCPADCSIAGNWMFSPNIGNVWGAAAAQRRYDMEFETSSGDLALVYGVNSANTARDLAYKVLPANSNNLSAISEQYIDDSGHATNIQYSWVRIDRKPTQSEELIVIGFDLTDSDINAWVWNGTAWGNQIAISNAATATGGYQALGVRYSSDGTKAMAIGADGTAGVFNWRYWNGSTWSASTATDIDAGDGLDIYWANVKADPSSDDLQAVYVDSGNDLHTGYWNGSAWAMTSNIDTGVDVIATRPADFEWNLTNSVGRLVWDTDAAGTTLSQRSCAPQCTGATSTISTYAGTGAWVTMYRNTLSNGNVRILSARLNSNFDIGSFYFSSASTYANYGVSAITADTTVSTFEAYSIAFYTPESVAPIVNLIYPPNAAFFNYTSLNFTFNYTDRSSATANCSILIDGTLNQSNASTLNSTNTNFTVSGLSQGLHNWSVRCTDQSNNTNASLARNFTIDTAAPAINLISPPNNASFNTTALNFTFNFTDNISPTANCSILIDGTLNQSNASTLNNTNASFTVSSFAQGLHNWSISCIDLAGNRNISGTRLFLYALPPNISDSPDPQGFGYNVTVYANVSNASGVLVGITPPGGNQTNYSMQNTGASTYAYNFTGWANGTYAYTIYANVSGGFWIASQEGNFALFQNLSIQVRTLEDAYSPNETINITDPEYVNLDAPSLTETSFGDGWMPLQTDNPDMLRAATRAFSDSLSEKGSRGLRISARARDGLGVRSVVAMIPTLHGAEAIPLSLSGGNANDGIWAAEWVPHDLTGKHFIITITAENTKRLNQTSYVSVGDPPGLWVLPTSHSDPANQWDNEYNARDGNTHSYASDNSNPGSGWGAFIYFNTTQISSDRVRVWADYGAEVGSVDIDVYDGSWTDAYQGAITSLDWNVVNFTQRNVTAARFRYNYTTGGYIYWLYELQFYNVTTQVNIPTVSTRAATSVEESTAVLHSIITSDGGDTCTVRFLYGTSPGVYPNATSWTNSQFTGSTLGTRLYGLSNSQTYYFIAQVNNSAGASNGSEQSFTTGPAPSGWVSPTGYNDSSGQWDDEMKAFDDELSSEASSFHQMNDPDGVWSPYLYLNRSPSVSASRIRFSAKSTDVDLAEVSVFSNGSWATVYNSTFTDSAYASASFNQSNVSAARIRFRAIANNRGFDFMLAEFDFFKEVLTAPENQSKLENHGPTNASCYLRMKAQFFNGSGWMDEDLVVNESAPRRLQSGDVLKLDTIWNAANYSSSNLGHGDGTYRILAYCNDNASLVLMNVNGSFVNATYNFTYDGTPPSVIIISPANGTDYALTSIIPIRVNVTDAFGSVSYVLANVSNSIGWELVNLAFNSSSGLYETSYANTNYVDIFTIRIIASDNAGNINSSQFVQVDVIDNITPAVVLVAPPNGYANISSNMTNVTFRCNVTDNYDTNTITLFLSAPDGAVLLPNATVDVSGVYTSATFNLNLTAGTYIWNCLANDSSNNTAFAPANWTLQVGLPNCPIITSPGDYLQLADYVGSPNLASPLGGYACVKIASSNVTWDCQNRSITGNTSSNTTYGVEVNGSLANVTVRNCNVSNYTFGMKLYAGSSSAFIGNIVHNNTYGIDSDSGSYNNFTNNAISSTVDGISLTDEIAARISGNNVSGSSNYGIRFNNCTLAVVSGNNASNNTQRGIHFGSSSSNSTVANNTLGFNLHGILLGANVSGINITGNSVFNNSLSGISLSSSSSGNSVVGNTVFNNTNGMYLNSSVRNAAANNSYLSNWAGIRVTSASNNCTFFNESLNGNAAYGIQVSDSYGASINASFSNGSQYGIYLSNSNLTTVGSSNFSSGTYGIAVNASSGNTIIGVLSYNNSFGIYLSGANSTNVTLSNFTNNNDTGAYMGDGSTGNVLLQNWICLNSLDLKGESSGNSGSYDRCDSFMDWAENGHLGCEYTCSSMWHRFFGNANGTIVLTDAAGAAMVYSWNATALRVYLADIDSAISWQSLQAVGRTISNTSASNDFPELDAAFNTTLFADSINRTYSADGTVPKETRNFTVYDRLIPLVPVANSTAFNTTFRTGILWDMSDGGAEYSNSLNQSTVWAVTVNASANDTYGTYDFLVQVPESLATYEGSNNVVSVYVELE